MKEIYVKVNSTKKSRMWFSVFISSVAIYILLLANNVTEYYYDSWLYDQIAQSFYNTGQIQFDPTQFSVRAYTWPLVIAV